jgi:putative N6-adenine-specific DNA methylase
MNNNITMVATCILGVEGLVANELKFMGAKDVTAENGRVVFKGDFNILARANICCRYAERILILLSTFTATTFQQLFDEVSKINWNEYIGENDKFPVKGTCLSSSLMSVPDCQKIIKKSTAKVLSNFYGTDWLNESGDLHQIQFLIFKDKVSIMLDTTGTGLYKRGYRENSNDAPIKETLAAVLAELSMVRANHTVIDPMCGSGTILIESALKAMKIAPGINRNFAAENWLQIPAGVWAEEREKAKSQENRDCKFIAYGFDIDNESLNIAKENAYKAGVGDKIIFANRDVKDFVFETQRGSVITNPPYGERLLDIDSARKLYKIMGSKFVKKDGWSYTIISPDDEFEKIFGRKADKRRKLYNGMLKCQAFMYFKK